MTNTKTVDKTEFEIEDVKRMLTTLFEIEGACTAGKVQYLTDVLLYQDDPQGIGNILVGTLKDTQPDWVDKALRHAGIRTDEQEFQLHDVVLYEGDEWIIIRTPDMDDSVSWANVEEFPWKLLNLRTNKVNGVVDLNSRFKFVRKGKVG